MWNENPSLVSRKSLICICAQQSAYGEGHPEEGGTGAYIYIYIIQQTDSTFPHPDPVVQLSGLCCANNLDQVG